MKKFILILLIVGFYSYAKPLIVAIDIGHTPKHYGALSARGVTEYFYNTKIANTLLEYIKKEPKLKAFLINPNGKEITLKQRVAIAKAKGANIFIALHHDSAQPQFFSKWSYKGKKLKYCDKFSGYSIFVSKKNPFFKESLKLATLLAKSLKKIKMYPNLYHARKIKGENRELLNRKFGIYRFDNLVVLKYSKIPALLLECGVIINRKEELKISTKRFRDRVSRAIIKALLRYKSDK